MTVIQNLNHEIGRKKVQIENKDDEVRQHKVALLKLESERHTLCSIKKALTYKLQEHVNG